MSNSLDQPPSLSGPSVNPASRPCSDKNRRASKACSGCRTRKVRCDVLQTGRPCTKCRLDGFECVLEQRKKRRRRIVDSAQNGSSETTADKPAKMDVTASARSSSARSLSQHAMLHQVPHYPFFREFAPRSQQLLLSARKEEEQGEQRTIGESGGEGERLADDDLHYLRQKGALELPAKRTMDELVANYFQVFHPFFPVVDKYAFLESYYRTDYEGILSRKGPSLLLLQAVLFTSSAYLYDFDFEGDDVTTIQALLLMSHYYPSMVEQKHTWFWVHQAISLAQGAGLHRDARQAPQRKLWARIWWACLVRDRLVTLGTGRPMQINSLDCSVPMLTLADLDEEGDSEDGRAVKAVFVEFVRLCQYMEGVLSLPHSVAATEESVQQQIGLCETTLAHWKENLAPYHRVLEYGGAQLPSPKVQAAAQDSTRLAVELIELDLVKFCPTICVTAILPPLIAHLLITRASRDHPGKSEDFNKCIVFLKQLGEIYWHASFYNEFFELAASSSQNITETLNGARDPLVTFLNDRMPGRQQFCKVLESQNQSRIRRRTLVDNAENAQSNMLASDEAGLPALSSPSIMAEMPDSERLDSGDVTLLDPGAQLFEDWLVDLGSFHNIFPSA
ncbi:hypothetical protein N7474_006625 [Penicillium riverlandense]|uniref:uncharacterized protein n=1 Tax=Penicillium riverlandense TaxID=1903569 RepID=UPI002548B53A|nr:uncharacterized protein N7474_006625 [Penicillium riverlandense]KAJ5814848.1 hypothetical protein N7474_006625 [Penicillium riverlandense]